jgi:hypothetical protein
MQANNLPLDHLTAVLYCFTVLAKLPTMMRAMNPSIQPRKGGRIRRCLGLLFLVSSLAATSLFKASCSAFRSALRVNRRHLAIHGLGRSSGGRRQLLQQQRKLPKEPSPSAVAARQAWITLSGRDDDVETEADEEHYDPAPIMEKASTIWEDLAMTLITGGSSDAAHKLETISPSQLNDYVQYITLLRVGMPALLYATIAKSIYPSVAMAIAANINDSGVFAVVAQDASQYIQNILTTAVLVFSLLVGQTHYFMYQQQEATFMALYQEVSMAKILLEQVALVCQGREQLYQRILKQMDRYVCNDLQRFNDIEPAILLSARPCDDPLEDILFLTSVGEPSNIYQTVRNLRQARAYRLGALQRKLPSIHMTLLWVLAGIVLFTFPLLGAGVQTIGGPEILMVQSWYLSFIVFGIALIMGIIYELQRPGESGAYNARTVLTVMVRGLNEELQQRMQGQNFRMGAMEGPSIDGDGSFDEELLHLSSSE